jgi:hypothetical protein
VRPIVPEEIFPKLIWRIAQSRAVKRVNNECSGVQYGVKGTEALLIDLKKHFDLMQNEYGKPDVMALDAENAYGSVDAREALNTFLKYPKLSHLIAPAWFLLGGPILIYWITKKGAMEEFINNKTCLLQGSGIAPMAFCLLTLEGLIKTNRAIAYTESIFEAGTIPDQLEDPPEGWEIKTTQLRGRVFAYLDDITGVFRPGWNKPVYRYIRSELAKRHIKFNSGKTETLDKFVNSNGAIKVLGVPVYYKDSTALFNNDGTLNVSGKAYKIIEDQYAKKVAPWIANMNHEEWKRFPAHGTTILGKCGSGKLTYWARNLDPALFEPFAKKYDEAVVQSAQRMMGIEWHRFMNEWITLPARLSGLGLISMTETGTYAPACLGVPGAQRKQKLAADKAKLERLLVAAREGSKTFSTNVVDPLCAAVHGRLSQPHSAYYTLAATLPAAAFTVAMAHRFASTVKHVSGGARCACCHRSLDIDHHLKCSDPKVNFVLRHSDVQHVVTSYANSLGHEVHTTGQTKTGIFVTTGEKRFDQVIYLQHDRSRVATDVNITYKKTSDAEEKKRANYVDVLQLPRWKDTTFYPLVATACGDITEKFEEFLLKLTLHRKHVQLEEWRNVAQTSTLIRNVRIAIARAIAEANCDLFLKCAGDAKPPGWA